MVKVDLVMEVQEKAGLSQAEAVKAVEQIISIMKETLAEGETVKLSGFGMFLVRKRVGTLIHLIIINCKRNRVVLKF